LVAQAVLAEPTPTVAATALEPPVKKSTSGICHDSLSPSYTNTKHFEAFETLDACIQSGGRLPKNRAHTPHRFEPKDTAVAKHPAPGVDRDVRVARAWRTMTIMGWPIAGAFGICLGIYLLRARTTVYRAEERRAFKAWSGHRLERSDDVFKRRHHRWDPWLKKIGYFDKNGKKN
jgi:hypothetical protein